MKTQILPKEVQKAQLDANPNLTILYGDPKSGKSTLCSMIPNALMVDLAEEYKYVDAMRAKIEKFEDLAQLGKEIKESGMQFKVIVIDNASLLYELVKPYAIDLYRKTANGKFFKGNLADIPYGGQWYYSRMAFMKIIEAFMDVCPSILLIGYVKTMEEQGGEKLTLDLPGQLRNDILGKAEAVGRMFREKNENIIDFQGIGNFIAESRVPRIRGRRIIVGRSDKEGKVTSYWEEIFK